MTHRTSGESTLGGKSILGTTDDLPKVIRKHELSLVVVAIMELPAELPRQMLALCSGEKARLKVVSASFTQGVGLCFVFPRSLGRSRPGSWLDEGASMG